jgi:hypothetical protein
MDLIDLFCVIGLAGPPSGGFAGFGLVFCCCVLDPSVCVLGWVSVLGRTVDALVPGADEGRGGPR